MTKIDIFSGFLGAGKTTLIKKLISEAFQGEKLVLIENEFGEIGIDGGFLKDSGINITEMNSGCICCSLVGDFGTALNEVLEKYAPDRIIIEPSGVGKLSDVIKAVSAVMEDHEDVEMNGYVTVADATKCKMYMKNFGEFFNNQIENAGTVVLSRTDVVDAAKVQQDVELIREHNASASIVTTPCSQLSGAQLLEIIEKPDTMAEDLMREVEERRAHEAEHDHEHHHHHHDDDDECECGCHDHDHEHHHHHDDDDDECECGCHDHDHEHHHHDHDDDCDCGCHDHDHHHHHHHADEVFTSWGMENVAPCKKEELEAFLQDLSKGDVYGQVLRAKGMIPSETEGEWYYFDLVPEEYEIRKGQPDYTGKVCVIGAKLDEEALKKVFHK